MGEAIVELGDDAYPEASLLVLGHIQFFQAGRLGEAGVGQPPVDCFPIAVLVYQPREVVEILAALHGCGNLGEGLTTVAGYTQVRLQVVEALLGQQAESGTAAYNGGLGYGPDVLDDFLGGGKGPLGVNVA